MEAAEKDISMMDKMGEVHLIGGKKIIRASRTEQVTKSRTLPPLSKGRTSRDPAECKCKRVKSFHCGIGMKGTLPTHVEIRSNENDQD